MKIAPKAICRAWYERFFAIYADFYDFIEKSVKNQAFITIYTTIN